MKRQVELPETGGCRIVAVWLLLATLFFPFSSVAQEEKARNLDIYPDYNSFLPSPYEGARVSFIDRSSDLKQFPKLMGPPQCPHEAFRKKLKFPVMGNLDLTLFCAPGDNQKE